MSSNSPRGQTGPSIERTSWGAYTVIGLGILALVVIGVIGAVHWRSAPNVATAASQPTWTARGTMGDYWGGFLGAGAAFAGFFLMFGAFMLQREELRLQRSELRLQREEYVRGREEAERQTKALNEQIEELKGQRVVAERQAAMSRIATLGSQLLQLKGKQLEQGLLLEVAVNWILGIAEHDQLLADDMLDYLSAFCVWVMTEDATRTLTEVYEARWKRLGDGDLYGPGSRMRSWLTAARTRVEKQRA